MKKIRLKPEIFSILTSEDFETFTAPELTAAYLQLPQMVNLSQKAASQFVQRNIKRLHEAGHLAKLDKSDSRSPRYRLITKLTDQNTITGKPHRPSSENDSTTTSGFDDYLIKRINQYKVDLLTSIGEVEEYEILCRENPARAEHIQVLYNNARDRYSKNLGRVKALESLVGHN